MLNEGHVGFYRPPSDRGPALALNRAIAIATTNGAPYRFAIASKLGHVITVTDVDLMLLTATFDQPQGSPAELGAALVERLLVLGKGLSQQGKPLTKRDELLPYATQLAETFLQKTLPQWRDYGICE